MFNQYPHAFDVLRDMAKQGLLQPTNWQDMEPPHNNVMKPSMSNNHLYSPKNPDPYATGGH